jgi:hypothetical protein
LQKASARGKVAPRESLGCAQIAGVPGQATTAALRGRDDDLHTVAGEDFDGGGIDVGIEDLLGAACQQGHPGAPLTTGGGDTRPSLRGRNRGRRQFQHRLQGARHERSHRPAQTRPVQGQSET